MTEHKKINIVAVSGRLSVLSTSTLARGRSLRLLARAVGMGNLYLIRATWQTVVEKGATAPHFLSSLLPPVYT